MCSQLCALDLTSIAVLAVLHHQGHLRLILPSTHLLVVQTFTRHSSFLSFYGIIGTIFSSQCFFYFCTFLLFLLSLSLVSVSNGLCYYFQLCVFLSRVLFHNPAHALMYLLLFCKLGILYISVSFLGQFFFIYHMCNLIFNISFMSSVLPFYIYSFICHLSFCIVLGSIFTPQVESKFKLFYLY